MFTLDATIDAVQTGKKTFVNTFVQHEAVKEAMIKFIDAQADYTKKAVKAGTDAVTTIASESVKAAQEASKFDYAKFQETVANAFKVKK